MSYLIKSQESHYTEKAIWGAGPPSQIQLQLAILDHTSRLMHHL